MAGEEQTIISPWMGILNSIIPTLQLVFVVGIVGFALFIVWKRNPFKGWSTRVLIKHKRGKDYTPEFTEGRREKNKEGQMGYMLKNKEWIPAPLFSNMRMLGKKAFVEVWQNESGKYIPAPSPFETEREYDICPKCGKEASQIIIKDAAGEDTSVWNCDMDGIINSSPLKAKLLTGVENNKDEFTQADTNWLIDQHRNDVRMFEKKNRLMELLPFIVPLVTIIIVVLGLVLYQTQVLGPQMNQILSLQEANTRFVDTLNKLINSTQQNQQAVVIPTGK